jgi:hypothetical protein
VVDRDLPVVQNVTGEQHNCSDVKTQKVEASKLDLHMSSMRCELVSALKLFLPVHWIVPLSLEMMMLTLVCERDCCDSVH